MSVLVASRRSCRLHMGGKGQYAANQFSLRADVPPRVVQVYVLRKQVENPYAKFPFC